MSKLPLPVKKYNPIEIKGNLDAVQSLMAGTATGEDIRMVANAFSEYHPYLKYLNMANFTDKELLERQTESVAAVSATVNKAFNGVAASVLKVAGSSKGLPSIVKWMGMGTTWGAVGAWAAFDWASGAGMEKLMSKFQLNTKGISDLDGLDTRRDLMPPDAKFQIDKGMWIGENPLTIKQLTDTFNTQIEATTTIVKMADTIMPSGKSPEDLDAWLANLNAIKGEKTSTGAVSTPALHGNLGVMIYKNGSKYFVEEVKSNKPTANIAIVPLTAELLKIQQLCKTLIRKTEAMDSKLRVILKRVSGDTEAAENKHLAFAGRTLRELGATTVKSNKQMLRDAEHFVRSAIAAIITADVDAPKEA